MREITEPSFGKSIKNLRSNFTHNGGRSWDLTDVIALKNWCIHFKTFVECDQYFYDNLKMISFSVLNRRDAFVSKKLSIICIIYFLSNILSISSYNFILSMPFFSFIKNHRFHISSVFSGSKLLLNQKLS